MSKEKKKNKQKKNIVCMIYFIKKSVDLFTLSTYLISYTPFTLDLQRLSYLDDYYLDYNSFGLICTKYLQFI